MAVRAVIASLPTEYSVDFSANQLRGITEVRTAVGRRAQGRYEFYGARMTRYSGEQLHTAAAVRLEFDLQGVLLSQVPEISATEVAAIRSRGQLLRSHALAQQAARAH